MIDPLTEVDRLRHSLIMGGYSAQEADAISSQAKNEIDFAIFDIVSKYLDEARDIAYLMGGEELLNELKGSKRGPMFMITTESGVTDFSTPPFPMLPHLLKNAKTSKDGHKYKVIPIKDKQSTGNIFDVYKDINNERRQAAQDRKVKWDDVRTAEAIDRKTLHFSGLAQAKRYLAKRQSNTGPNNATQSTPNSQDAVTFRTASDKQDASKDWVLPPKKIDMTNVLNDINNRMQHEIDSAIRLTIMEYSGRVF